MQKRTLHYSLIILIAVVILTLPGFTYFKNKNSIKAISIKDVKVVKLFPFHGINPVKEYSYDTKNSNDMKAVNNIISYLNSGKSLGVEKMAFALNGGAPPRLLIELTNGQNIEITATGASTDQVLMTQSNTNKTFRIFSPELRKLFKDEVMRIFNL